MNKIQKFIKKHLILSIILSIILVICIVNVIIELISCLLNWIGKGICLFGKFVIESLFTKEFLELCIDFCNISQYRLLNALVFYISMYLLFFVAFAILRILVVLIVEGFVSCGEKMAEVLLEKKLHKNLDYTFATLWLIKYKAESTYFISWLKETLGIWGTYTERRNLFSWVRVLSIENLFITIKKEAVSSFV